MARLAEVTLQKDMKAADAPNASVLQAARVWFKIGCLSFGGPAGQIALMHREIVDHRRWFAEKDYLSALNFCMLLPGPEAMQLATYIGWRLHGVKGGLAAGLLFVLPGACVVMLLAMLYASFDNTSHVKALFFGMKAAVLVIVVEALLRVARRALANTSDWLIAGFAFLALFCFDVPFPLIVILAGLYGYGRGQDISTAPTSETPPVSTSIRTVITWAFVWLAPLVLLLAMLGPDHTLTQIGLFFSKLALVTFGGAYAVLSYMAQAAVEDKGWLTAAQMMDGLGLAETTPGPLILVTQFVGYLTAYDEQGGVAAGLAGGLVALWMTFAPSFLFIFACGPYVQAMSARPRLGGALASITAAVVGVILNLSVWFGLHVLFGKTERQGFGWFQPWVPEWSSFDAAALVLSVAAGVLLLRFHFGIIKTLAFAAMAGFVWKHLVS